MGRISGHEVGLACFICLIGIYSTSMAVAEIQDVQGSSSIMGFGNQSREGSRPPEYHAIVPSTTSSVLGILCCSGRSKTKVDEKRVNWRSY